MRTISMVSDKDGEKLRAFEQERQKKIKEILAGAIVTDVLFDEGMGISGKDINGLTLVKGEDTFSVSIDHNQFYEVTEVRLIIENQKAKIEELITMPTPCDTCTKKDCKSRSTPGSWVVACKES